MNGRSLGHRAPLLWLVVPFVAGLVLGKMTGWSAVVGPLLAALATALAALSLVKISPWRWGGMLVVAMTLAGLGSYALHRARLPSWETLPPREVRISVKVERVFRQAESRRATGLGRVTQASDDKRELVGQRIYFSVTLRKGEQPPLRSAVLDAVGVLAPLPVSPPANSFDGYLAGAGTNFRLTRARLLATQRPARAYFRFCARAETFFHEILGLGIAEKRPELARLLRAMMLGTAHELSEEQHALFMQSGTMHLFAISGLNIGVVAAALQTVLLLFRLPPWARLVLGAALLWLFVDITGASPSAVRAFAMAVFLQAARVLHRPANLLAALLASAFAVLLLAPLQLFSTSFLMSYTIVAALLLLGLPLGESCTARWSPWRRLPKPAWSRWQHALDWAWRSGVNALAIGAATTLVSLLTGVEYFGLLTPGSLVANLILIPAAMVVTLGGFASLVCGMIGFAAGAVVFNHASALLLAIIEAIVRVGVRLPGAFMPAQFQPAWVGNTALVLLLAALLGGYAAGWRLARAGWWPPFAIVAIVLIFGVEFVPR